MKREPPFKPHPTKPGEYLCNLAGILLMAGETLYGDPAETTPEGQQKAGAIIDRVLREATARGFRQGDILRALLRRNDASPRLLNLATDAMDCIPMAMRNTIVEEEMSVKLVPESSAAAGGPDYPVHALRPGPDGVDPRFWAAGNELERIAAEDGPEAIHKPEHAHLYAQMFKYAPEAMKAEMRAKAEQMNLIPKATYVSDAGTPVFSAAQVAAVHGVTVEEVERAMADAIAAGDFDPEDLYTGPVHPLQ